MMRTVDDIVERLGGLKAVGTLLNVGNTAVWNWKDRKYIPAQHYFAIREALVAGGHGEPPQELFSRNSTNGEAA